MLSWNDATRAFTTMLNAVKDDPLITAPANDKWDLIGNDTDRLTRAVERYIDRLPTSSFHDNAKEAIKSALMRQVVRAGPKSAHGYGQTLVDIVNLYADACTEPILSALWLLATIELSGFSYPTHTQTITLIRTVLEMVDQDPLTQGKVGEHERRDRLDLAHTILCGMGHCPQSDAPKLAPDNIPLCAPEIPALALKVMRAMGATSAAMRVTLHYRDTGEQVMNLDFKDFWIIVRGMTQAELGASLILRTFAQPKTAWVLFLFKLMGDNGVFLPEVIKTIVCNQRVFDELDDNETIRKFREWQASGKPCSFLQFVTQGLPPPPLARTSAVHRSPPAIVTTPRPAPPPQEPTGHKRHHPNYKAPEKETPEIDWQEVTRKLRVADRFPELNETLVQAILVQGILREGDRYGGIGREVKDKSLVKAVRRHSEAKERDVIRTLDILVREHVLVYRGGAYRLATPTELHPKARELSIRLRAITATLPT